jgi:hypothetical protein
MSNFDEYLTRKREDLPLSEMSDDQLANAVYLYGDRPSLVEPAGEARIKMPIVYLTAAKERIRWLNRKLNQSAEKIAALEAELSGLRSVAQSAKDDEGGPDLCQDNFR